MRSQNAKCWSDSHCDGVLKLGRDCFSLQRLMEGAGVMMG